MEEQTEPLHPVHAREKEFEREPERNAHRRKLATADPGGLGEAVTTIEDDFVPALPRYDYRHGKVRPIEKPRKQSEGEANDSPGKPGEFGERRRLDWDGMRAKVPCGE